jgi:hypothetical protein
LLSEDIDKLDKEVQEFLEQPEVKDTLEQLEVSKQRLEAAIQVLGEVEDENDPRIEKILVAEAKDLIPPDVPLLASTSVPIPTATVPQTTRVEAEQANTSLLSRMKLRMWRSFFATANDYRKAHQNVCDRIQDAEQLFSVLGTIMDAGQIGAGAAVDAEAGASGGPVGIVAGGVIGGAHGCQNCRHTIFLGKSDDKNRTSRVQSFGNSEAQRSPRKEMIKGHISAVLLIWGRIYTFLTYIF